MLAEPAAPGVPVEEDRRALLGYYSSYELQCVGLTVALFAALLADVGLAAQNGTWIVGRWLLATIWGPLAYGFAYYLESARIWGSGRFELLRNSIPPMNYLEWIRENDSDLFKKSDPDWKVSTIDGLSNLDLYYSCLVREKFRNDRFYQWIQGRWLLGVSLKLFVGNIVVVGVAVLLYYVVL